MTAHARAWVPLAYRLRARSTPKQVAQALGVQPATVRAWMKRGILSFSVGKRGFPLIRNKAVRRALMDEQVAKTVAAAEVRRAR